MQAADPENQTPGAPAPFELRRPPGSSARPLIFASPHSGRVYPAAMMALTDLDAAAIRRSEDAFVDHLIAGGLEFGASLITNRIARAYLDVNREAWELDPAMFEDELPAFARAATARVAAGLGSIARTVGDGREIYRRKLLFAEAEKRIESVHAPWHSALETLVHDIRGRFGKAVIIDWHSMPSAAARTGRGEICDFVLGDRYGRSCRGALTEAAAGALETLGYRVARNTPYAGGYTTEHYGRPDEGVEVLQIEINRALYLDEAAVAPGPGFAALKRDLERLFAVLAAL